MIHLSVFSAAPGRPRKYADNAQKMRIYRREKRIKFWMDREGVSRDVALDWYKRERRVNSKGF